MGFVNLLQWFALFVVGAGVVGLWVRALRPAKDDPRLSKGLQILQSKISILEDLSDRTDAQVKQLTHMIEKKTVELQQAIGLAEQSLSSMQQALAKSKEMSRVLQAEITQESVIERKNISKYIQAAQLAHHGRSNMEIAQKLGLSPAEVDFIAKVNKNQFVFNEENLPAWIESTPDVGTSNVDNTSTFIQKIAEQRTALVSPLSTTAASVVTPSAGPSTSSNATMPRTSTATSTAPQVSNAANAVRPYEFKKMEII